MQSIEVACANEFMPIDVDPAPPVRFFNVISTKRSGHHAFISWYRDGSSGKTEFLNNQVIGNAVVPKALALAQGSAQPATIILNYEGVTVPGVKRILTAQRAAGIPAHSVLFVRDPLNLCASLVRRKPLRHAELVMVLRQLFALRNWLRLLDQDRSCADLIFYNRWLADEDYRAETARLLGVKALPVGAQVTRFGGGSSFQDLAEGGSSSAPRLLRRWKGYEDDSLFRSLVTHPVFADVFLKEVAGELCDALGENDGNEERAAFLRSACRQRRRNPHVDRLIEGLARANGVFETIEMLPPGPYKRYTILKAHLRAVLSPLASG